MVSIRKIRFLKKDFIAIFEETVYFLPLSPQEVLVFIWMTSEIWKADSILEPPSDFELGTPQL